MEGESSLLYYFRDYGLAERLSATELDAET
jgi:hypothetical protein